MSTPDAYQRSPLRYRRFGGGYRREDVESALAELRLMLRQVETELESLRDRNRDLESELQTARSEVESFRASELEMSRTMAAALRRAADIEDGANARAREIVAQAEEAAVHIRSEASRKIEESSARVNELLRLKDNLLESMRGAVGDFDQAISRVERGERLFPAPSADVPGEARDEPAEGPVPTAEPPEAGPAPIRPPVPPPLEPIRAPSFAPPVEDASPTPPLEPSGAQPVPVPPPAAPAPPATDSSSSPAAASPPPTESASASQPVRVPPPVAAQPPVTPPPPPPVSPPPAVAAPVPSAAQPTGHDGEEALRVFDTRVELDAGPFSDFAALSAFERQLARLPSVEDVYVRRLADDRALIELTLSEPVPLLDTMRDLLPYVLEVRSVERSKIVLDVSAQTTAGAR